MLDHAIVYQYNPRDHSQTTATPFAACNRVGLMGAAGWSVPPIEQAAGSKDADAIAAAYAAYVVGRVGAGYRGVVMHDIEFVEPDCLVARYYPECLSASAAALPLATHGMWLARFDVPNWSDIHRRACEAAGVLMLQVYPQKVETADEACLSTLSAIFALAKIMPGKAMMPCLASEYGGTGSRLGRVVPPGDYLARRQAVGLAQNYPGVVIKGCVTWGAASTGDTAKIAAMTALGESLRPAMDTQRRFEQQLASVPAPVPSPAAAEVA